MIKPIISRMDTQNRDKDEQEKLFPNYSTPDKHNLEEILDKKISFIFNTSASQYSPERPWYIKKMLGTRNIECHLVKEKGETSQIISKQVSEQGPSLFIVVGGDGIIKEAANVERKYLDNSVMGFIVIGNINDLSTTLEIRSEEDMSFLIKSLKEGRIDLHSCIKKIDLTEATYFTKDGNKRTEMATSSFSVGWTGRVCHEVETNLKMGLIERVVRRAVKKYHTYIFNALKINKDYEPLEVKIKLYPSDEKEKEKIVNSSNVRTIGYTQQERNASMLLNPNCDDRDGLGELFLIEKKGFWKSLPLVINIKMIKSDKHITSKKKENSFNKYGVNYFDKVNSLEINILNPGANHKTYLEICGEASEFDPYKPITAKVLPNALNVLYRPELVDERDRMHYEMNPGFTNKNDGSI